MPIKKTKFNGVNIMMNERIGYNRNKRTQICHTLALFVLFTTLLTGCDVSTSTKDEVDDKTPTSGHTSEVATEWFDLSIRLIEESPGFSPPVASRALGYMGTTLYEAVVPGMPAHNSFVGRLNELQQLPQPSDRVYWPAVANSALAGITRKLFRNSDSELLKAIDDLEEKFDGEFKILIENSEFDRSSEHGRAVAEAIYTWSQSDGGHEGFATNFPDDYTAPTGPGMWISTPPAYLPPLQPWWGNNRPFAISAPDDCPVTPHPAYSEEPASLFYTEAYEVYETVQQLTDEQRKIALFWADDPGETSTPPGHWTSILNQVITDHNHSLDVAAEAYARLGIALADAFIACWYEKYQYNLIRPISYIQQVIDPDWNNPHITDPVITPPFPEYPSGHSVQSGAAAMVLTELFGEVSFTDRTHEARGLGARSYSSFWDAAEEAAISRLYGGIHYRAGIDFGVEHGRCIGGKVNAIPLDKAR